MCRSNRLYLLSRQGGKERYDRRTGIAESLKQELKRHSVFTLAEFRARRENIFMGLYEGEPAKSLPDGDP
jgi:hypothetical protein